MARVIITDLADADTAKILEDIAREAGPRIAGKYSARIDDLYDRLAEHPESCQARPRLGMQTRVGVVYPYLVIYRHDRTEDTVSIIRVIDGRRRITRKLLQGGDDP